MDALTVVRLHNHRYMCDLDMDKLSWALTVAAIDQLEPAVGSEPTKRKVIDITPMGPPPALL